MRWYRRLAASATGPRREIDGHRAGGRARSMATPIEGLRHALAAGRFVDHDVLDPRPQAGGDAEEDEGERADDRRRRRAARAGRWRGDSSDLVELGARSAAGSRMRAAGVSRSNAATSVGGDLVTLDDLDGHAASVEVRDRLRRRRADVLRARADDPVVGGLLEDVGAPADHPARRERRREQLARQAAAVHHDAGVELDVRVELAAGLELGEHARPRSARPAWRSSTMSPPRRSATLAQQHASGGRRSCRRGGRSP